MISIITDTPEELQRVFEILRQNDTQVHIDTVAQVAKEVASDLMSLNDNPYTR